MVPSLDWVPTIRGSEPVARSSRTHKIVEPLSDSANTGEADHSFDSVCRGSMRDSGVNDDSAVIIGKVEGRLEKHGRVCGRVVDAENAREEAGLKACDRYRP
jgi:hypothetical protein